MICCNISTPNFLFFPTRSHSCAMSPGHCLTFAATRPLPRQMRSSAECYPSSSHSSTTATRRSSLMHAGHYHTSLMAAMIESRCRPKIYFKFCIIILVAKFGHRNFCLFLKYFCFISYLRNTCQRRGET